MPRPLSMCIHWVNRKTMTCPRSKPRLRQQSQIVNRVTLGPDAEPHLPQVVDVIVLERASMVAR